MSMGAKIVKSAGYNKGHASPATTPGDSTARQGFVKAGVTKSGRVEWGTARASIRGVAQRLW